MKAKSSVTQPTTVAEGNDPLSDEKFPRHAFDDIVDGSDQGARGIQGGSVYQGFRREYGLWDRATWERCLADRVADPSGCNYVVDDKGIWIRWGGAYDAFLHWHPQAELEHGDDPKTSPVLPFPFTGRQLAAYFANGPGWSIGQLLIACVQDANSEIEAAVAMVVSDPNGTAARKALKAAWVAWADASRSCGLDPLNVPEGCLGDLVRQLLQPQPTPYSSSNPTRPEKGAARRERVQVIEAWLSANNLQPRDPAGSNGKVGVKRKARVALLSGASFVSGNVIYVFKGTEANFNAAWQEMLNRIRRPS